MTNDPAPGRAGPATDPPRRASAGDLETAQEFADRLAAVVAQNDGVHDVPRLAAAITRRDAAIRAQARAQALRDVARTIDGYWEQQRDQRKNEFGKISDAYDEGFLDGVECAEHALRALNAACRRRADDGGR